MAIFGWKLNFAPVTVITIAALLAIILAGASTVVALSGPMLGVKFDSTYDGEGVSVLKIREHGPSVDKLIPGDTILAFVTPSLEKVAVSPLTTIEDPDQLASYAEYNAFFAHQQVLWQVLSSPSLSAIMSDGRAIKLATATHPSLTMLPATFWWLLFFGGASFLLGMSAWSMRRGDPVARVLAVSGVGFMAGAYSCAIYSARELAMPGKLFFALSSINHLGIMVFAYSAILFFWYYPKRLGTGPAVRIWLLGIGSIWLNETLQWLSWPIHAFYAHFVVAYCLLLLVSILQWHKTRGSQADRILLKWLLTTVLVSLGFAILLFYVPVIYTGKPIASNVLTFGSVFLFYLGLVIGNIRYHQFDMERWWIEAWQWLGVVFITMIADAFFIYFMHLTDNLSLEFAIGIGFIYLLARQWLWGRVSGNSIQALDRALPHLVDTLILQQAKTTPDKQWQQLIARVFDPTEVKTIPEKCAAISIERNGIALHLPNLDGRSTIEAFCCDHGKRLFTSVDVTLSNRLLELMRHSGALVAAHEQGVKEERRRIQRDLHDDVAARLLSLIHRTHDPVTNKVARNALRGLRDVVHLLGAEEASLKDVMNDIEAGAREQMEEMGVHFKWISTDDWPPIKISSPQHINLRRIVREAIANALKHAKPENIILQAEVNMHNFCLRISNDGILSDPSDWSPNRGLNNIKSRVEEMGGSHKWGIEREEDNKQYCRLTVCAPLSLGEQS